MRYWIKFALFLDAGYQPISNSKISTRCLFSFILAHYKLWFRIVLSGLPLSFSGIVGIILFYFVEDSQQLYRWYVSSSNFESIGTVLVNFDFVDNNYVTLEKTADR